MVIYCRNYSCYLQKTPLYSDFDLAPMVLINDYYAFFIGLDADSDDGINFILRPVV